MQPKYTRIDTHRNRSSKIDTTNAKTVNTNAVSQSAVEGSLKIDNIAEKCTEARTAEVGTARQNKSQQTPRTPERTEWL